MILDSSVLISACVKLISQEMETDKNEDDEKKKKKGEVFIFSLASTQSARVGE